MPDNNQLFGSDLALLPDLLRQKSNRDPGHDLRTEKEAGPLRPGRPTETDLATWSGDKNLYQALLLRLLTPAGELAVLGHPEYGSRLHELIGKLNNETTRNRAKFYALQALNAEPRIEKILSVQVTQNAQDRTRVDIAASLRAIKNPTIVNLVFPFSLQGEASL